LAAWLIAKRSNHCRFSDAGYETFVKCSGCCDPQWMTIEAIFPEKVTRADEAYDCLFTSLRNDGEL
jgi:hypothetical protein